LCRDPRPKPARCTGSQHAEQGVQPKDARTASPFPESPIRPFPVEQIMARRFAHANLPKCAAGHASEIIDSNFRQSLIPSLGNDLSIGFPLKKIFRACFPTSLRRSNIASAFSGTAIALRFGEVRIYSRKSLLNHRKPVTFAHHRT